MRLQLSPSVASCSQSSHAVTRSARRTLHAARRAHLQRLAVRALPDQGEDISEALKADLEKLRAKSGARAAGPIGSGSSAGGQAAPSTSEAGPLAGAKDALDKLLIADFFLILFILAWLAAGVAQNALSGGSSPLLDAWYPLWPILWQPALGVLMAGALVSGGISWLNEQGAKQRQR